MPDAIPPVNPILNIYTFYFKDKGIPYIDADIVAREVVEPGTEGLEAIVAAFGSNVLHDDGTLNREALGAIVFHNEEKRQLLHGCLKTHIRNRILELTSQYESVNTPILIYDIPLLIEGEWYTMMDEVWLVYVNEPTQIDRLMSRNGYTREDALARINSQMRLDDKRSFADLIIDNNGTSQALTAKLDTIWSERLEPLLQKPQ